LCLALWVVVISSNTKVGAAVARLNLPYVTAIVITGSIGFVCILLASYQAYAWQKRNSHLLLIATNIAIVVTIFVALFFADFCIA
jgi:hypothetical protein